jgi:AcrR family transcriptional regulator
LNKRSINKKEMPRTTVQNEQIREATRANILDSAMSLFARHGYASTSIRRISEQAGVSVGLMYHYFEAKESLLQAVFDHCIQRLSAVFEEAFQGAAPGERLASLLRAMFDLLEREQEFWALFYMLRSQPAIMEVLGDAFRLWTGRLRHLFVAELRAAGWPEPELEALLLYSLIEGTIQQYLLDPLNYPLDSVVQRLIDRYGSG